MPHHPATPADPEELLSHLDWLSALARQLVGEQGRADDLTQDTVVVALQRGPADPSRMRSWLAQVARNLLRQGQRGEARRRAREETEARPEAEEATDVLVERVAMQRDLARLVLELEEPLRATVLLRFYSNLPPCEIAARLGVPVTTVHGRLQRALARLRDRLDRSAGGTAVWSALLLAPVTRTDGVLSTLLGGLLVNAKIVLPAAVLLIGAVIGVICPPNPDPPSTLGSRTKEARRGTEEAHARTDHSEAA